MNDLLIAAAILNGGAWSFLAFTADRDTQTRVLATTTLGCLLSLALFFLAVLVDQ